MKMGVVACMVFLLAAPSALAQADRLIGVWKVTEINIPDLPQYYSTRHQTNPQPSIYIFTKKYFSVVGVAGEEVRPDLPQDPTIDQLREAWSLFDAEAGTYKVEGSTITFHPLVAKDPKAMNSGESPSWNFKFEGTALILTVQPPDAPIFIEAKLTRLE